MVLKRIVLVRPGEYPEGLILPLGLLYIAGYLRKKIPGIEISIIDAPLDDLDSKQVAEKVKAFAPDLVGLTGLSFHIPYIKEAAREIKQFCPKVTIVVGGAGITSDPNDLIKELNIDFGVLSEGEETFYHLVNTLREDADPENVEGIIYSKPNGSVVRTLPRDLMEDLDSIPFPAYDLVEVERYFTSPKRTSQSPVYISKRLIPILTSRGCPLKCVFCHDTMGKDFRSRSPENIVEEIIWLKHKYEFEELEIVDDIFNFYIKHAKIVFRKLIDANLGLKIAFPNGIKYEMVDDELLDLFNQAGVYRIAFGIESGSEEGQKLVRKRTDLIRMNEIIDKADNMNMFVSGFFQLGLPEETKESMLQTVRYALSTRLHTAMFHVTTPFPGTPMYEEHVQEVIASGNYNGSRENYEEEIRNRVNFRGARDISMNLSAVSDKELLRIKKNAFIKFYFNPSRILSIWRVYPVKRRLFKNLLNVISEILFRKWIFQT
jgi:anaerobic magnesium-protoporphyrin IX monomethyl ester cyclase